MHVGHEGRRVTEVPRELYATPAGRSRGYRARSAVWYAGRRGGYSDLARAGAGAVATGRSSRGGRLAAPGGAGRLVDLHAATAPAVSVMAARPAPAQCYTGLRRADADRERGRRR